MRYTRPPPASQFVAEAFAGRWPEQRMSDIGDTQRWEWCRDQSMVEVRLWVSNDREDSFLDFHAKRSDGTGPNAISTYCVTGVEFKHNSKDRLDRFADHIEPVIQTMLACGRQSLEDLADNVSDGVEGLLPELWGYA